MELLALWWHNLTHRHYEVTKPNVAEIFLCYPRWRRVELSEAEIGLVVAGSKTSHVMTGVGYLDWQILTESETPEDVYRWMADHGHVCEHR